MTYIQAREKGGHVRKGEKGFLVVKYGTYTKETEAAATDGSDTETRRFLKAYTVFNACQIEGIEFPQAAPTPDFTESEKSGAARDIVAAMPNPPPSMRAGKPSPTTSRHSIPSKCPPAKPSLPCGIICGLLGRGTEC